MTASEASRKFLKFHHHFQAFCCKNDGERSEPKIFEKMPLFSRYFVEKLMINNKFERTEVKNCNYAVFPHYYVDIYHMRAKRAEILGIAASFSSVLLSKL